MVSICILRRSRDENIVAALRPPPALDVNDAESVVVVIVQSALQTAQLVLLSHLWTIQEATNHVVASMPRCDASLRWRLERHDGSPLDPDELVGVLDFAALDTLYIETDDEMIEPEYVAVSRALLRALVLECDGMLNVPTNSASSTPRTSTDQYGYVPRSSGESAASVSAFEAEFDAILDKVALDLDDDDASATQTLTRPPSGGQYGWIGSVRETPSPTAVPKMSAEARQVRRKLRQTVTRSRTVLKAEHLINAPIQRRSRDLALRAAPAHYLRTPPKQNDAIDSNAPPPVRPRGPPPKKPAMAPARKKRVKAASPLATVTPAAAPPPVEQAPPPIARPMPLSRSPAAPTPQRTPVPPVSVAPVPAPVPRPASLGSHGAAPAPVPARQGQRVAAATTASVIAPRAPTVTAAVAAVPPRPLNRPGGAKPLPAPPSTANAAKPHRPTAPPPRTGYATMGLPTSSFRAATASVSAREQATYSNLPATTVDDGYANLPAHTLRIQRENMGLASDDEGLEIEVFDDSLLSQLQQ
jgi:hypothetical protein